MLVPHDYWIFENAELNSAFKFFEKLNATFEPPGGGQKVAFTILIIL